ncbi:MAG: hypothetical protein K0S25_90 [Bacillus sp. (in: firmicutes)]|jgi:hypothetical protein|nr:hypothetical protein [Bacillus sp. (in: firmicutes)]
MRLRKIQSIVKSNLPGLMKINSEEFTRAGVTHFKVTNYNLIWNSAVNLLQLGLFEDEKEFIEKNNLFFNVSTEQTSFDRAKFDQFSSVIKRLMYKATAVNDLIELNLHSEEEAENSLIISLPSRKLSLQEFSEISETLYDTFRMMNVLKEFNSDISIENFDVGTNWIVLSFISTAAVSLMGKLVSIVQRSQVGNRQIKALDKQLESIEISEEVRNQVREAQINANLAVYTQLTTKFLEENDLESSAEIISQMTKVTENIDKILNQGVGFEASISASNEVAKTFPTLKEQKLLDQNNLIDSLKSISHDDSNEEKPLD